MNEIARPPHWHDTTQTADGLPRLRWTLAEFERLSELGFFGGIDRERERLELVDGELLPMQAKGGRHEWVRLKLQKHLTLALGAAFDVLSVPGWRPGGELYLEPDILVCGSGSRPTEVRPADVLLVIELADSRLGYDKGLKAHIYATLGVREYWVVDANTLDTTVHLSPSAEGYANVTTLPASATLSPTLLPALAVSLGGLGIA